MRPSDEAIISELPVKLRRRLKRDAESDKQIPHLQLRPSSKYQVATVQENHNDFGGGINVQLTTHANH